MTKQTRGIDSDDLTISNSINNSNGKLTQFGISSNNSSIPGNNCLNDSENLRSSTDPNDISLELDKKENEILNENNENSAEPAGELPSTNGQFMDEQDSTGTPFQRSNSPPPDAESKSPPLPNEEQAKTLAAANDAASIKLNLYSQIKSLPWEPKVRLCELEAFLDQERKKFLGYGDLNNDLETLVGLPNPIHESVKILRRHLYISLADEQIKLEEKFIKYPLSTIEIDKSLKSDDDESSIEILFSNLLNNLPQYLVSYKIKIK